MKRISFFFYLLLLIGVCEANAGSFRATVPYRNVNGKLIARVEVNGHAGTFLIDTGAPCCVSYSFAQKLGLKAGSMQKGHDSNGQLVQAHLVVLDSLKLGNVSFLHLEAMRWEKGNMTEQFGIDGIIGYNLMKMGIVKFDSRNNLFTFTDFSKDLGVDFSRATPLVTEAFVPHLIVNLGKQAIDTVMFDSGAADFYEMSTQSHERLRKSKKAVKHLASGTGILSMGASGLENSSLKHRLKIPRFTLAGIDFDNVTTITTDGHDSRIGSAILAHGDVIIDYKHRTFYYLPHDVRPKRDLYTAEWDVVITVSPEGHLTAGMVWDPKLPIRSGSRILSVNGKRFEQPIDMHTATTTALISMPGNEARISYLDTATGQEKFITIRKR